jgi:chemotaxis protein MotB
MSDQRNLLEGEENNSHFMSISDLMTGLLFVFIITLVGYLLVYQNSLNKEEKVPKSLYDQVVEQLNSVEKKLSEALEKIKELESQNLNLVAQVEKLNAEKAALFKKNQELEKELEKLKQLIAGLTAEELVELKKLMGKRPLILRLEALFAEMSSAKPTQAILQDVFEEAEKADLNFVLDRKNAVILLDPEKLSFSEARENSNLGVYSEWSARKYVEDTAAVLEKILPCYLVIPPSYCKNKNYANTLDLILVEGHSTDRREFFGIGAGIGEQIPLDSIGNALKFHQDLLKESNLLTEMTNAAGSPIFSVTGHGATRPIDEKNLKSYRNRRIELRFVMRSPNYTNEVDRIFKELKKAFEN